MLKLTIGVLVETVIGLVVAGVLLAVVVPLLIGHHFIAPGDLTGSVLIGSVTAVAVAGVLLRPGSVLKRHTQRDE